MDRTVNPRLGWIVTSVGSQNLSDVDCYKQFTERPGTTQGTASLSHKLLAYLRHRTYMFGFVAQLVAAIGS